MTLDVAIALLAFSAPVTAAIIIAGKRARNGYVKQRDFDVCMNHFDNKVVALDNKLDLVLAFIKNQA